ncbi:MAG: hypothetical protein AMXMBFR83_02360 [Phycisphaerae bacterium]
MPRVVSEIVDVYVFRRPAGAATANARQEAQSGAGVEFLLLRRSPGEYLGGTWQAVHGRIEPGETAWQTALRELREETGLTPIELYQIDAVNTFYMAADDVVHHCPCFAAEVGGQAGVVLDAEHEAFEWVSAEDAMRRFIWPGQRRAVREIIEEILRPGPATAYLRIEGWRAATRERS